MPLTISPRRDWVLLWGAKLMGNRTYLVNGIMQRPDRCQTSLKKIIYKSHQTLNATYHCLKTRPSSSIGLKIVVSICEHKLLHLRSIFSGLLIKDISLYSFFLSTFFLLSPQHSATLWSSLRFTKCRRFILRQNFCSAALLWVIFVLALLFSRFLLPFWWESQVETGVFLSWLWISLTSSSVDFLSQQLLQLAWTGFSRCYWDWDTDTQ